MISWLVNRVPSDANPTTSSWMIMHFIGWVLFTIHATRFSNGLNDFMHAARQYGSIAKIIFIWQHFFYMQGLQQGLNKQSQYMFHVAILHSFLWSWMWCISIWVLVYDSECYLGNITENIVGISDLLLDFKQPWQRSSKVFLMAKKEGSMFGTYKSHYKMT